MRKLFYVFLFLNLLSGVTYADMRSCFRDAQFHNHHRTPHSPGKECIGFLKESRTSSTFVTSSGKYRVLGEGNMFYVKKSQETELMAGDQTSLRDITSLRIDEKNNSIIAIQNSGEETSYSLFNLDGIGNVRPYTVLKGKFLQGVTSIFLFPGDGEVAQVFSERGKIVFMNFDADSRSIENGKKFRPQIKRTLTKENADLKMPKLIARHSIKEEIYVLDGERIIIIALETSTHRVVKVLPAPGRSDSTEMLIDENTNRIRFFNKTIELPYLAL